MTAERVLTPDVAIVGSGPAGLAAAAELAPHVGEVLVIERETCAGGIPRHSDHTGYGVRDMHRVMRGPAYAARLVETALESGATIQTESMVTALTDARNLQVTTPGGLVRVEPRALILATGARERPRSARMIPGNRPAGVFTTGQLQNLVHLQHQKPGKRAVVIGAEMVSWSAVLTLRESGCETALMTSAHSRPESYSALNAAGRAALRVPVATTSRVVEIVGHGRVEAVQIEDMLTGSIRRVDCDVVVLTGDWIPDNELARVGGLDIAPGSLSPVVDASLRTSACGIFAIGNLVHPVDTADVAALDGRHVGAAVGRWLQRGITPPRGVVLKVEAPLRWISPSYMRPDDGNPARGRLLAWADEFVRIPVVEVRQDGRPVSRHRLPWPAAPGRVFRIPFSVLKGVDHRGSDVTLSLA